MPFNDDSIDPSDDSFNRTYPQQEPKGNFIEPEDYIPGNGSIQTNASSIRTKSKENYMINSKMETFADIIAVALVKANKNAKSSPPTPRQLGVIGLTLSSGLDILHRPPSETQQAYAGVTSKYS